MSSWRSYPRDESNKRDHDRPRSKAKNLMSEIREEFVNRVRQLVREVFPMVLRAVSAASREASAKADGSLVTETDCAVEAHFVKALESHFPGVPVLGEEMSAAARYSGQGDVGAYYANFMSSPHQIIIDPIDGTKNFVEGKREFCIAAALTTRVENGIWPIAGVVAVPNTGMMYYTEGGGVREESVVGEDSSVIERRQSVDPLMSASSKDRWWLATHGYSLSYPWISSGSSVHDFLGTCVGRLRGSVTGAQRLWDLMAPLALANNLGCVLRDLITDECVTRITPEHLSSNLERRAWGLDRKMLLLPAETSLSELVRKNDRPEE
jgi:fructose-1,6-bisphosphatase/inositol monophosphatase family enzyme